MKSIGFIILLHLAMYATYAQTTGEWLQQKKTRIKYLSQQVAALQMYLGDLKKGYRTVKNGLNVINDIKHGDFNLHHGYFSSLSSISPNVKGYNKVQGISDLQAEIIDISNALRKLFSSPFLSSSDQGYITATINNLLQKCLEDMDKLNTVIASGGAEMTDEQRLKEINSLYESTQDKYSFALHLKQSTQALLLSRSKEKTNASTMYLLYGLK